MRVLLIEDDPEVVQAVSLTFELRWAGISIVSTAEGSQGIEMVETESPDLVLMELKLPDMDGFEILRQIRSFSDVPIIIASVWHGELDRVRGLEMGADDYIVKPLSYIELLARVKAVLRRTRIGELRTITEPFASGDLTIDFASQEVRLEGKPVKLTPTEYRLLCHLISNIGQMVPQQILLEKVWGEDYADSSDYLKVHIHRLRQKLGDTPKSPQMIVTVPGRGYKFIAP